MSANIVEKVVVMGFLGVSALFIGSMYFRGPKVQKFNAFKVRQELLERKDTKMLYSTMSFFYLQGFNQQSIESLFTLQKILQIQKPNIVALPISKEDYDKKYVKAMAHPKYKQAMDKLTFYLKNRDSQSILNMKQFDLKNLQKLYLIDYCIKLKKCKVICGRRNAQQYKNYQKIYKDMKQKRQNLNNLSVDDMKVQDYAESIIEQMNPKLKFSLLPQSPYKTIVGTIEPELLHAASKRWKQKFKQAYSHQVIEDQQVLERQKIMRQAQNKQV